MDGILGKTPLPNRVTARKSLIAVIFSTHHFHEPKVQRLCNGLVFRRPSNLIPAGNFYVKPIVSRSVCMAAIVSSSEIISHWEDLRCLFISLLGRTATFRLFRHGTKGKPQKGWMRFGFHPVLTQAKAVYSSSPALYRPSCTSKPVSRRTRLHMSRENTPMVQ
jgi:hypothetical protein